MSKAHPGRARWSQLDGSGTANIYRGYNIERRWITKRGPAQHDEWGFHHPEYDGPGDPRCGYEKTYDACIARIDEIEDEE